MFRDSLRQVFLFSPDDVAGGSAATAVPDSSTVSAPDSSVSTTSPGVAAVAADATGSTSSVASAPVDPSAAAVPSSPSWLDNLRSSGIDAGKDEKEALAFIQRIHQERQALEQLRPYVPHVNAYLQNAQKFNEWQRSQQGQQAPASPSGKPWDKYWTPPEYNTAWQSQITKDANGNLVPVQGAPPDVVLKYQQYQQYRSEQAQKFMDNPHEYIAPTVEAIARQQAEQIVQQHLKSIQDRQAAQTFTQTHAGWLFDLDPSTGQPKMQMQVDPQTGQTQNVRVLSQWGNQFSQYVQQVTNDQHTRGYHDEAQIQQIAMSLIQRDFAVWKLNSQQQTPLPQNTQATASQATPPLTPQQQANQAFLDRANPPGKQGVPARGNVKQPEPEKVSKRNLERVMREELAKAGYN